MLDLKRLIGVVFHSSSPVVFREIKNEWLKISPQFEADDMAVVGGEFCQGSGEITGMIANLKRCTCDTDFVIMTKSVIKAIGDAMVNNHKSVVVISDQFSPDMEQTIAKMRRLNETFNYKCNLHFIQISTHQTCEDDRFQRTFLSNASDLHDKFQEILGG